MENRKPRQHNRYSIRTFARVRKIGSETWTEVRVETLSPMGACFRSSGLLNTSDNIEFYMPLPDPSKPPYHLSARVVWTKNGQVGIEFTGQMTSVTKAAR